MFPYTQSSISKRMKAIIPIVKSFLEKVCYVGILHINISPSFLDFRFDKDSQPNIAPKCGYLLCACMYITTCVCTHVYTYTY